MRSLEEELPPEHDEEVLAWAKNIDKGWSESLQIQIDQNIEQAAVLLFNEESLVRVARHVQHAAKLLIRQYQFTKGKGPKFSDFFRDK